MEDYDFKLQYHLGKANVVSDALNRKPTHLASLAIDEWNMMNDLGFYALHFEDICEGVTLCNLNVYSTLLTCVIKAQQGDEEAGALHAKFFSGEGQHGWVIHADQSLRFQGKLFVHIVCQEEILRGFHHFLLAVHPGGTKMYRELRRQFLWLEVKKMLQFLCLSVLHANK